MTDQYQQDNEVLRGIYPDGYTMSRSAAERMRKEEAIAQRTREWVAARDNYINRDYEYDHA